MTFKQNVCSVNIFLAKECQESQDSELFYKKVTGYTMKNSHRTHLLTFFWPRNARIFEVPAALRSITAGKMQPVSSQPVPIQPFWSNPNPYMDIKKP